MKENKAKQALKAGKNLVGTLVKSIDPAAIEILGLAGFDFVIIDNEHTVMSQETTLNLIRTAELAGMSPVVRVRENSAGEILRVLDCGAAGVQVPMINTCMEAQLVVERAKYAPAGGRGYAASQRSARFGFMNPAEYAEYANQQTQVNIYCETFEGLNNLEEIVGVPGLDVVFIGPYDLSQALGVLGQPNHPKVLQAIENITKIVRGAGLAVGTIASDAAHTRRLWDMGIQYIALSSDLGLMASLGKQMIKECKQ